MNAATMAAAKQQYQSLQAQAQAGQYEEPDDAAYFEGSHHPITDEKIRLRILLERAVIRKAVHDILAAKPEGGRYVVSVYDGEEIAVLHSTDLLAVMAEIGACDEEYLHLYFKPDTASVPMRRVGWAMLVYGNDGWDVIADHTDTPAMEDLLAGASQLGDELSECDHEAKQGA